MIASLTSPSSKTKSLPTVRPQSDRSLAPRAAGERDTLPLPAETQEMLLRSLQ
ncbi:MAG: hypothetical protein Q7S23_01415 [bacterium]|nr:hypothetical protein [bacterium]